MRKISNLSATSIVNVGRTIRRLLAEIFRHRSFSHLIAMFSQLFFKVLEVLDVLLFLVPNDGKMRFTVVTELDVDYWVLIFAFREGLGI